MTIDTKLGFQTGHTSHDVGTGSFITEAKSAWPDPFLPSLRLRRLNEPAKAA